MPTYKTKVRKNVSSVSVTDVQREMQGRHDINWSLLTNQYSSTCTHIHYLLCSAGIYKHTGRETHNTTVDKNFNSRLVVLTIHNL